MLPHRNHLAHKVAPSLYLVLLSDQPPHSQLDALAVHTARRRQPAFPRVVLVPRVVTHARLVPLDAAGPSHPEPLGGRLVCLEAGFVPHEPAQHRGCGWIGRRAEDRVGGEDQVVSHVLALRLVRRRSYSGCCRRER